MTQFSDQFAIGLQARAGRFLRQTVEDFLKLVVHERRTLMQSLIFILRRTGTEQWPDINRTKSDAALQDTPSVGGQLQDFGIWGAVRDDTHMTFKIDAGFTAAESPPDIGIKVGVGLELDLQAIFGAFSLRARSNGSSISAGRGWLA